MAPVTLHRPLNEQRYIVRACVHSPYAFLFAKNQSDLGVFEGETVYNVKRVYYFISNGADPINISDSILLLYFLIFSLYFWIT